MKFFVMQEISWNFSKYSLLEKSYESTTGFNQLGYLNVFPNPHDTAWKISFFWGILCFHMKCEYLLRFIKKM